MGINKSKSPQARRNLGLGKRVKVLKVGEIIKLDAERNKLGE